MNPEHQDEKRRHERAASDASDSDQQTDSQPGSDEDRLYAMQH